jgi:hypothetical protein
VKEKRKYEEENWEESDEKRINKSISCHSVKICWTQIVLILDFGLVTNALVYIVQYLYPEVA